MRIIDISCVMFLSFALSIGAPANAHAFSKIIRGLESITSAYLVPLAGAVAGASFIVFIMLSYFRQDEYQRKVLNVLLLSVIAGGGLEMIKKITEHFG